MFKPCWSRPDGREDQRPKGKAPRESAEVKRNKRERGRRPLGSMDHRIAGGIPGLSQIGTLSALRVTTQLREIRQRHARERVFPLFPLSRQIKRLTSRNR
ncbi:hypothetical protein PUN28_019119 [Cardiocondyla obscurior]|uniref:Uncharacterized protein n=1 Tax=Cardiocondyla obscurior TaxID=286306 RepID=A0AAW2EIY9_9HYME